MAVVSLAHCSDYDYDKVRSGIKETIKNLGGLETYLKPGEKVLLKVNLLMKKKPEEATTTHPVFVKALSDELLDFGVTVLIGDSPGGPFNENILRGIYKVCGYEEIASQSDVVLNYNISHKDVKHSEGILLKQLTVGDFALEADKIISVSKLKTHGMMKFTGAVKNMFGIIPGLLKAEYHFKMPDVENFSQMLVDVCTYASPVLSFMDGIVGMEGAGPSGGEPRQVGAIIASDSPYHLDVIATQLIGIDPMSVPTIGRTVENGRVSPDYKDIELVGASPDEWQIKDYVTPNIRSVEFSKNLPAPFKGWVDAALRPRPVFRHKKCIGCGDCAEACPPHVIEMKNRLPYVNLDGCIRCFCCQELCPAIAIDIKRPWLMKIISKG
jgi:uncharacterized protein (DUF362 family)/NAD-dependent dihydropyrimidine dehydrogenase PreA subunit